MLQTVKSLVRKLLPPALHKPQGSHSFEVLGTEYGAWPLLKSTPVGAVVFSFGVGRDISFDLTAIEKFGCIVHAFDPTPKSNEWIQSQNTPGDFHFHPYGVAGRDGDAEFAPPQNSEHVSYSATSAIKSVSRNAITVPVNRLSTLISKFSEAMPEVIKMDIEGFEYEVIRDMLTTSVRPQQFLVEFHHDLYGFTKSDTLVAVEALIKSGYQIFYVSASGREYGFCRDV
jgi:FkbM family methyltransferase